MRKIKIGGTSYDIEALTRGQIKDLVQRGFDISTVSIGNLKLEQWDNFIDALMEKYCIPHEEGTLSAVSVMDELSREERRAVELELIAETWGSRDEEKN
jgi:hypothetical protein